MLPHRLLLLILLSVSVFAQPKIPKEIKDQLLVNETGACADPASLKASWVDLNGDRIPEVIVKIENSCHCGASGDCDVKVFKKGEVGYVELFTLDTTTKLYAKETVTKGYRDLVAESSMGVAEIILIVFKWDGSEYQIDTCWHKENVAPKGKFVWKPTSISCSDEPPPPPKPQKQYSSPQPQQRQIPQNPPQNPRITPPAFTIPAGSYLFYPFVIRKSGVLYGRFEATGGNGNDIEVLVLGQDEFTNWKNGHIANAWYNSGRLTVSNILVQLPPGVYYLIFSNTFSILTPKAVTANIFLRP